MKNAAPRNEAYPDKPRTSRRQVLMRFCMVTTFYPPYNLGGCGTYVRALSRALVAQGHDVEVMHCLDAYRLKSIDPMPDEGRDEGIVVHRLESPFGFLSPLITQLTGTSRNQIAS